MDAVKRMEKKLLYIFDYQDHKSRIPLALAAQKQGYAVRLGLIATSDIPPLELDFLRKNFSDIFKVSKPKRKFNPFGLIKTVLDMRKILRSQNPDIVHVVTLKYSFLFSFAALFTPATTKRLYTIAGLGFLFRSEGIKPKALQWLLAPFLKYALKHPAAHLIFQNSDDRDLLIAKSYADPARAYLVISSGVDLQRFIAQPAPNNTPPIVLMPTRLVREKGVHIFFEAAKILQQKGANVKFQIAGGLTAHNPQAITAQEMQGLLKAAPYVEWLGEVFDMPACLAAADIVVYPSYYGEGVPRVLIEACASGRPIITTDHTGCRETVREGVNGYLVPIKNVPAVAIALERMLSDQALRSEMGRQSRLLAEEKFALEKINAETLACYARILNMAE
ncbi:MAG: glycosyltransferase family 4 protein [Alphaproteobacteria bacterium]